MSTDSPPDGGREPPRHTRFQKGRSGNPAGRPRKRVVHPPYEAALGQMVTIQDEFGGRRSITAEEAFVERNLKLALKGDITANRRSLKLVQEISSLNGPQGEDNREYIIVNSFLFSVNDAMLPLGMAQKLNKRGRTPRILLEPWLVDDALSRLGDKLFTVEQQREIWGATRTPGKVNWPAWWTERRGTGRRRPEGPLVDCDGFRPPCVIPDYAGDEE